MENRKWLPALAASAGMLALILDSKAAFSGGAAGVELCIRTVIPSLFPFLFLSGIFASSFSGDQGPLLRLFGKGFHLPPEASFVLVPALLCGYPVGAQCIFQSYRSGLFPRKQAERLLSYCSNVGPAFIFGILSLKFTRKSLVWMIWAIQILSIWTASRFFGAVKWNKQAIPIKNEASQLPGIETALQAIMKICGWVILFRVVIEFLDKWILHAAAPGWRVLMMGLVELSNGCCALNLITQERLRFVICNVLLALGGLCVAYQTGSVCPGLRLKYYYAGKLLQAVTAGALAYGIINRFFFIFPVWAFLTMVFPKCLQKRVEIPRHLIYNGVHENGGMSYAVSQKD